MTAFLSLDIFRQSPECLWRVCLRLINNSNTSVEKLPRPCKNAKLLAFPLAPENRIHTMTNLRIMRISSDSGRYKSF